ncbi:MAG TPA: hypothetical protein IAC03_06060 [Candidatus Coprenecus pullistercoris]|nr:hypothetical protein [Candidatus Coprenecus pullistercoris]
MRNEEFITVYAALGHRLMKWLAGDTCWPELETAVELSARDNAFFTPYMQCRALEAIACGFLAEDALRRWLGAYPVPDPGAEPLCGVVAAGNIPAVAFHDILSVLAAGWKPVVKLSSKDRHLLPVLFPDVEFCGSTDGWRVDAMLTMGGDAAAGYFREHFPGIPKLIRASRFSLAVIAGDETPSALEDLAEDMLLYYGLGCRSVVWLIVPAGYDMCPLTAAAERFAASRLGRLAADNHRKNKAVLTLAGEDFIDGGTVIFRRLGSGSPYGRTLPVGEVWYSEYSSPEDVENFIRRDEDRIQKIIRNFGYAQRPGLEDWPDGVDAVEFLRGVKH